ncbi:MAG: phasin family protein [Methyloceanibacter sp.]
MAESDNPKVAAEKARDSYRKTAAQFEELPLDTQVPEAMRALVEKNITQTRELYERSKDALEAVLGSWERSFDAAGQGAVALNRKVIDIVQGNINSSFDLAKSVAGAKNLAEAMELQAAYWRKQLGALTAQAEEVRTLSTKVTGAAAEPIKAQVTRGIDELRNVT